MRVLGLVMMSLAMTMTAATVAGAAERLQVPQVQGWKVVNSVNDQSGEATEMIPETETAEAWTRRIALQAFRGAPLTTKDFLDQVAQRTAPVCDGATAGPVSLGKVSGKEAGTRTVACGRYKGDGKGTFTLFYVIRGNTALYVVSRIWRGAPFDPATMPISTDEMAEWTSYVNAIELCDTTDPAHACR